MSQLFLMQTAERVGKYMRQRLFLNTFESGAATMARQHQLGLELNEYLWVMPEPQLQQTDESVAQMINGIERLIMHGTIPSPDLDILAAMDLQEVRKIYEQAYKYARLHNVSKLVFHSGFVPGKHTPKVWLEQSIEFWNLLLANKPSGIVIYVENMVDDDPKLLKKLCDEVQDTRLKLCLDVGHAHCNSSYPVSNWIEVLNDHIRHMHLHNNDGQRDRHWALEKGSLDMSAVLMLVSQYAPDTTYTLECDFGSSLAWLVERGYID